MSPTTSPEPDSGRADTTPPSIPAKVRDLFETSHLEDRFGLGYELATVDEDGWPRIAMLSHGEIMTTSDGIRLGLWSGTTTARNLDAGRPALLSVVAEGFVCYLSGRSRLLRSTSKLDVFEMTVERVRLDSHEWLPVQSPIIFEAADGNREATLTEWRSQREVLGD